MNNLQTNAEGYPDPTAYYAIKHVEEEGETKNMSLKKSRKKDEEERFCKLLSTIRDICDLSGFSIEGRIVLKDKKTGKTWR